MKQILVITAGFEPATVCLEGRCSIQLSYVTPLTKKIYLKMQTETFMKYIIKVGAAGFEPATSWSQTRRDDRTTLRPEKYTVDAERLGLEPRHRLPDDRLAICSVTTPAPLLCFSMNVFVSVLRVQIYNVFSFCARIFCVFF